MNNRVKAFALFVLVTVIVVYISVPVYGVIRDSASEGEVVFVLGSTLPETGVAKPKNGIIERMYNILFPSREVIVPIEWRIDIKGRIIYSDQTPYVNGLVELRSEPRYSRTDNRGYFVFTNVEEGAHYINILDEEGNNLIQSPINIERNAAAQGVELVRLPDNTFIFKIALNIEVLELTLTLGHSTDGLTLMLEKIQLGFANLGSKSPVPQENAEHPAPMAETPNKLPIPIKEPAKPSGGPNQPASLPTNPENPQIPEKTPANPIPSVPLLPSISNRIHFNVVDTMDKLSYGTEGAVGVNIFGEKKRIAPGMKGSYLFTVDNRRNDHTARYNINFVAVDTLPPGYENPIRYRLKRDGIYVAGSDNNWYTALELQQYAILEGGQHAKYMLDWYWPDGEKDIEYAQFGGDPKYFYRLTIQVRASEQ